MSNPELIRIIDAAIAAEAIPAAVTDAAMTTQATAVEAVEAIQAALAVLPADADSPWTNLDKMVKNAKTARIAIDAAIAAGGKPIPQESSK